MQQKIHIRYSICRHKTIWFVRMMIQLPHRIDLRKNHLAPDAG